MMNAKRWSLTSIIASVLILMLTATVATTAQRSSDSCPDIVQEALSAVDVQCANTGRNQACYGHGTLEAVPCAGVPQLDFNAPGAVVDVAQIERLKLASMNVDQNVWGVALMKLQANLPDTQPGQNVTFLMFGDVELQNAVGNEPQVTVTTLGNVNLRSTPTTSANNVLTSLAQGATLTANGRLQDGSWLRVHLPDESGMGWVFADLVGVGGDVNALHVVESTSGIVNPMQAFYFRTGIGDSACETAPNSGILIRSPQGAYEINLTINDVQVQLASSAYIQAEAGNEMRLNLIEGKGRVQAFGVEQSLLAGTRVRVPLDDQLKASAPPSAPERCSRDDLNGLPVEWDCDTTYIRISDYCPAVIPYGMNALVHFGAGFATREQAQAAMDAAYSTLTVNGQPVPIRRFGPYYVEAYDHYAYGNNYEWNNPAPGSYTLVAVDQNQTQVCQVTVLGGGR